MGVRGQGEGTREEGEGEEEAEEAEREGGQEEGGAPHPLDCALFFLCLFLGERYVPVFLCRFFCSPCCALFAVFVRSGVFLWGERGEGDWVAPI